MYTNDYLYIALNNLRLLMSLCQSLFYIEMTEQSSIAHVAMLISIYIEMTEQPSVAHVAMLISIYIEMTEQPSVAHVAMLISIYIEMTEQPSVAHVAGRAIYKFSHKHLIPCEHDEVLV